MDNALQSALQGKNSKALQTISEIYYDPVGGFQNVARTLAAAQRVDKSIRRSDVLDFMNSQKQPQLTQRAKGYNSFIPQQQGQQMQFDLAFAKRFPGKSPYKYAFIAIDSFSKKLAVIPQKTKESSETAASLDKAIEQLGVPATAMFDEGTEFKDAFKRRLAYYQISGRSTRKHALFAERVIRTMKEKLLKRMEAMKNNRWDQLVDVVVKQYNSEEHSAIGMPPNDATRLENHTSALESMKSRAKNNRKYADINVGDSVRLLQKPEGNRASYRIAEEGWTRVMFRVLDKTPSDDGIEYTLENQTRTFLRHEMQLVTGNAEPSEEMREGMLRRLQNTFPDTRQPAPAPTLKRLRRLRPDQVVS